MFVVFEKFLSAHLFQSAQSNLFIYLFIYLLEINSTRIQKNNKITLKINGNCERKIVEKETTRSADAPYKGWPL